MVKMCHECNGGSLKNPYYMLNAVVMDSKTGKFAISDDGAYLCDSHYNRIKEKVHSSPQDLDENIFYIVKEVNGKADQFGDIHLMVQDKRIGNIVFLSKNVVTKALPKSARHTLESDEYLELVVEYNPGERVDWVKDILSK